MNIKPIETKYKGYRFRSRLEARWAVFFDTLGLKWEYEKEGFDLDGKYYLPDFWLPQVRMWVEVKGEAFTDEQIDLCHELAVQSGDEVLMLAGPPDYKAYPLVFPYYPTKEEKGYPGCIPGESDCYLTDEYLHENRFYQSVGEDEEGQKAYLQDSLEYVEAVNAARSARFEHEESQRRHYGERGAIQRYYEGKGRGSH